MLVRVIIDIDNVSVLEFCTRTGGCMKHLLFRRSCGFDVIRTVIDRTPGQFPHVELRHPESAIIVNDIIYCNNGVFYHLDDFDALMDEEVISDYAVCSPRA